MSKAPDHGIVHAREEPFLTHLKSATAHQVMENLAEIPTGCPVVKNQSPLD